MTAAFNLPYVARSCIAVALVCVLAACGQRGPLYLPKQITSSTPVKPVAAPATTTEPVQAVPVDASKSETAK